MENEEKEKYSERTDDENEKEDTPTNELQSSPCVTLNNPTSQIIGEVIAPRMIRKKFQSLVSIINL